MSIYDFPEIEIAEPVTAEEADAAFNGLLSALKKDKTLPAMKKATVRFNLFFRPKVRDKVIAFAISSARDNGLSFSDGTYGIDLVALIAFFEAILPLILKLIELFSD